MSLKWNKARFIRHCTGLKTENGFLPSENNRKAKFYRLTAEGRKQLVRETSRWRQMARAIGLVMGEEGGAQ
jgi:DNA-binding PadR family transcriptional regulator